MSYINESIIYNIYPLGYCGAPRENDGQLNYRLDKIYDVIPHLKKLGINTLVFNPLFESSRHGYDTIDYRKVDCRLVGRDFFAFKDVQQKKWDSPYCGWFQNLHFNGQSPYGDPFWYEGWAGHYDLVKLNLQNEDVVRYLLDSAVFWIDEFGIDGLRLDAADVIDVNFFKRLKSTCKQKKPDFWLYGEITHGDYNRLANAEMLDSVTNYECYKGIYSSHNDHNYFEIAHSLGRQFANGGIYQNIYTYNFVDNHDVNRVASVLRDKNHLNNVYTMLYTMPGVPSIYYGSEYAVEGKRTRDSDYDLRPCLDLNNVPGANYQLCEHIIRIGKVRMALEALKYGKFENVNIQNEKLVYKRFTENQTVFIAFNLTNHEDRVGFDSRCTATLTDVLNNNETFHANGWTEVHMPAYSARIMVVNDGSFKLDLNVENESAPVEQASPEPEIEIGAKYRHYKGHEYEVLHFAFNTETKEKMVVYRSLSKPEEIWVRPYNMFRETIWKDGRQLKRFERI